MALSQRDWQTLRTSPLLRPLSEADIQGLCRGPNVQRLRDGQTLFRQGEPARAFYVVLEGWVQLYRPTPDEGRALIHVIGPSESFAEALIQPGATYPVTAAAITDARVVPLDTADMRTLIATNPRVAVALVATCCAQLHTLVGQIERVKAWSTRRRVADFLLHLCQPGEEEAVIELPFESRFIAARLGMTPSSLSRTLAALKPLGLSANGREIQVRSRTRLAAFVAGKG